MTTAAMIREKVERNKAYIDAVRVSTVCEQCGAQPIDWHREEHAQHPQFRLSKLRQKAVTIERIQAEIDACSALCRRCHMTEDGRILRLHRPTKQPPKACSKCKQPSKPLRRGLCHRCEQQKNRVKREQGRSLQPCQECDRKEPYLKRGRCNRCYRRWWRKDRCLGTITQVR